MKFDSLSPNDTSISSHSLICFSQLFKSEKFELFHILEAVKRFHLIPK